MDTNKVRNAALDTLAGMYSCPRCGAWASEPCTTPRGAETLPHLARINRACDGYLKTTRS